MESNNNNNSALYSISVIAKLFNMTERNVRYLTEEGIIHKSERGKYALGPTVQLYIKYLQDKAFGRQIEGSDYDKETALLQKAKREKAEIQLGAMKNEYHEGSVIEMVLTNMFVTFRSRILGIGPKISSKLVGKTAKQIALTLEKEFKDALTELSEYDPAMFAGSEVVDNDGTENDQLIQEGP